MGYCKSLEYCVWESLLKRTLIFKSYLKLGIVNSNNDTSLVLMFLDCLVQPFISRVGLFSLCNFAQFRWAREAVNLSHKIQWMLFEQFNCVQHRISKDITKEGRQDHRRWYLNPSRMVFNGFQWFSNKPAYKILRIKKIRRKILTTFFLYLCQTWTHYYNITQFGMAA